METNIKIIDVFEVGNYFINRANSVNDPITNKKLQKLVYYAQVWHFTLFGQKLFEDEIEAWVHGPAIPRLYRNYKTFEFNPIKQTIDSNSFTMTESQKILLDNIWDVYGSKNAAYLEALTHSELPWQDARKDLADDEPSDNEINLELAKEYYGKILQKN